MLTLPLEPTDDRANPAFKDASACTHWLGQLQLTNLHQAHATLRFQLDEFNRFPMRGVDRLSVLELLRETVHFIQADYAKKLLAKKLPLNDDELTIFASIVGLWQGMVSGYQRCLQACLAGDSELVVYGALLCQRCLLYSGLQIFGHLRTGYEFSGNLWQQMHTLYAFCEEQSWQLKNVRDEFNGDVRTSSCNATYSRILLTCHAHRADFSRQQLRFLDRWVARWSATVTIDSKYTASKGDAPPMIVDLDSALGMQIPQIAPSSARLRYLSMVALSKLLRVKLILLQQGNSPQQQDLGEDCNSAECIELLSYLIKCWCEGQDGRVDVRSSRTQQVQVCYGIESCYSYVLNKPFKRTAKGAVSDTLSRKQLATFGRVLNDTNRHDLSKLGMQIETWQIEDESIRGARLLRTEMDGVRLAPGQFVAIRPTNGTDFMVGTLCWVKVAVTGQLRAGVRYFPGLPQVFTMHATGVGIDEKAAVLLLPAVPALQIKTSIIAPRDWFKAGRMVELAQNENVEIRIKMKLSIEKGTDFERISCVAI